MTTNFADISHHQANVDLAAYKAAGHTRIVLKATEGTGFIDPKFAERWKEAGRLGLERVAYHFARAKFNGAQEFDFFLKVVNSAGGFTKNDSACLDVEDPDTPDRAAAEMREFANRAVAAGVPNGIIYTYNWYAVHHAISPSQLPPGWRRLWMADYTVGQADRNIELGAGWTWDMVVARQYTDKAQVAGIGSVDDSHFIHEWLTAVDAVSDTPKDWFDMATVDDLKNALRSVLNEGTGKGQNSWAGTEAAELATAQQTINEINELKAALAAVSGSVAEIGTAVANAVKAAVPTGSQLDATTLAAVVSTAVADELGKRLGGAA